MAVWTIVPDSAQLPDQPIKSSEQIAIKNNITALAEGASGAPRIQNAAMDAGSVDNDNIVDKTIKTIKLKEPTVGTNHLIMRVQEAVQSTTETTYPDADLNNKFDSTRHLGFSVLVPGSITVYFQHRGVLAGPVMDARVLKNGLQVTSWSTSSDTYVVRTIDISVTTGDVIIFQQRASGGAESFWRFLRCYSNNPDMAVCS